DGSSIHSTTSRQSSQAAHRTADAPPDLSNCPTQSSRRAMGLICQRRSTVVRRNTDIPALGQLYEENERGVPRDLGAGNVGAENVSSWAIHDLMPHARTADERGELCGLFDGNRSRAIDPTAAHQDAVVHVGNGSNPADHGDSGVTKDCGAIGDEAGAPRDKGRDESTYPQPDRLEGTCCFSTCVDNGESLVRDCGLDSQKFQTEDGRDLNFGLVRRAEDGEGGSPPRPAVLQDTRAGRLRHNEKLTNLTTAQIERALAPWNATAHPTKRGALRHAAQIVETDDLDPHVILQLAKHVNPFDLPQNTVRYLGRYSTVLTQVSSLVALM
ncbi:hypothetical protein TcCL_NonESM09878, partial [Trypanosoma cruzi]